MGHYDTRHQPSQLESLSLCLSNHCTIHSESPSRAVPVPKSDLRSTVAHPPPHRRNARSAVIFLFIPRSLVLLLTRPLCHLHSPTHPFPFPFLSHIPPQQS